MAGRSNDTGAPASEDDLGFSWSVAQNDYGRYCLPTCFARTKVYRVLNSGGVYEPKTIKMIRAMCKQGDIVSGGAMCGDFLPALHGALAPGAQLHTFEPNPIGLIATRQTIGMNGLDRVNLHPVAVSQDQGVLPFRTTDEAGQNLGGHSSVVAPDFDGPVISVAAERLDDLVPPERMVSVLHLDIEGHEWSAILGARRILRTCKPMIVVEAPREEKCLAFIDGFAAHFGDLDYRLCGTIERNRVFRAFA